jgi:hypothetical protein
MASFDYHVIALIPASAPFDLQAAIDALNSEGFKADQPDYGHLPGLRVVASDGWGVGAWLEDDDEAREMNQTLSEYDLPDGVTPEQISECSARLSIWSDDDPDLMNAHVFEEFIQLFKERFGLFLFDNRLGEWR